MCKNIPGDSCSCSFGAVIPNWTYPLEKIGNEVRKEINRAIEKHGWEKTPLNPDMDRRDAYIIVSEEHGEVARALTYDGVNRSKLEEEIIQTIAMNVAMLIGIRSKEA